MKRILCLLLVLTLSVGLFTGCKEQQPQIPALPEDSELAALVTNQDVIAEDAEDSTAEEIEVAPGAFSMPYNAAYGWDPYECTSMENRGVMQLIYEGLFTMTPQYDAEGVLCSGYEVSDDGTVYTLTIRGAKFSNGKTVTADDVVHSMNRAQASTVYKSRFYDIYSYGAADKDTVTIYMNNPNDRLPSLLTFPIVPEGSPTFAPVGTGPFVRNDKVLTPNESWWRGTGNLLFDQVTLYSSISAEDTRDSFEIDKVHFVYNDPSSPTAATFHCDYELWNSGGTVMQYIMFNTSEGYIFSDDEVRKSVTYGIDRISIAEDVYRNFADAASLPVSPATDMYDEALAQDYNYDPDQAEAHLRASFSFVMPEDFLVVEPAETPEEDTAEEEDTETAEEEEPVYQYVYNFITMLVRSGSLSRTNAARAAAEDLERLGFTVEVKVLEDDDFYAAIARDEYDLYYEEVTLRPDFDLRPILEYGGALNYTGYIMDETTYTLYTHALENAGNRYDLYQHLMDNAVICPVLFRNNAVFTTRGVFTGLNPAPDNLFYNIETISVQ